MKELLEVRPGTYRDSVTLMRVSRSLAERAGVVTALTAMGTELNLELLREEGFAPPGDVGPNDLVVAIRADGESAAAEARQALDSLLNEVPQGKGAASPGGLGAPAPARTTGAAAARIDAGLALVSVPGPYAFIEAMDALEAGLNVMVFSDNVPVDQEVVLKEAAARLGRIVMGPDCGTASIAGVGLGFANVVRPGPVGVVAASGTGAQQLMCLLDEAGVGVSHVLGVGGRDLSAEVSGRSTLAALAALDADPATELIVVAAKPPAPQVSDLIHAAARRCDTPVLLALLGEDSGDLTAAAEKALNALGRTVPKWPTWPAPARDTAAAGDSAPAGGAAPAEAGAGAGGPLTARSTAPAGDTATAEDSAPAGGAPAEAGASAGGPLTAWGAAPARDTAAAAGGSGVGAGRALRGLFAGGTLCAEATFIVRQMLGSDLAAGGHALIDFGDDAYTRGRAHPMIDPTLRLDRLAAEAADPACGVLLLDVVLGYGAEQDPAALLAPAIEDALRRRPELAVVVSLCGTPADPQGRDGQAAALQRAGAAVFASNAAAARHAALLAGGGSGS